MQFIQANTNKGLRWHVAGCRDLKKASNTDQSEPTEFDTYEQFILCVCSHLVDPEQGALTMAQAIKDVREEFCNCARKVLK
jgi:hypothetical protein